MSKRYSWSPGAKDDTGGIGVKGDKGDRQGR